MKVLKVKGIEWKDTKDGSKQYMAVVLTNGEKDSTKPIFEPDQQAVFQEAYDNDKSVDVEFEKKGQFWNVKSAQISEATSPKPSISPSGKGAKSNGGSYGRDEDRMDRRTALMQATELYRHSVAPQLPFDDDVYDGIFVHLMKLLNPVIAEAMKEGAKVVDKEGD